MRTPTIRLAALSAMLLLIAWASPAAASTPATPSAASLINRAVADARQRHWVATHITLSGSGITAVSESLVLGPTSAAGSLTIRTSSESVVLNITILTASQIIYVQSSAAGLAGFFPDMSPANTETYANQWLELTPADSDYTVFADPGPTSYSSFAQLHLRAPLRELSPTTKFGRRVIPILGKIADLKTAVADLYVTDSPHPLPVALRLSAAGITTTETWSKWGQGTLPVAPAGVVAFPTSSTTSTTPPSTTTSTLPTITTSLP